MSISWNVCHSDVGSLPRGWEVRRVGDLVTLVNGYPFPSESFGPSGDIPLVRIRDLGDEPFETYVSGHIPPSVVVRNGDAVIGMDGDFNLALWSKGPAALNQRLCLLRPRGEVDIRFIAYALPACLKIINDLTFSTTVKHLSSSDILSERLPLPAFDEQRRIADSLDAETARVDRLVKMRSCQIDRIEERFLSVLSELCTPGILSEAPRSGRWPWLPDKLKVARLGYFARVQSGVTVHGARVASTDDADYPYLRVANVQDGAIDLSEVKTIRIPASMATQATLRDGDVVITEANGNPDNLGRGAVWRNEIPRMVHQNHVFAIRTNRSRLLPEYVSALMASLHGRRYFRFTSSQVGIATTSSSKVLDFPIPLIGVTEQNEIVVQAKTDRRTTDRAVKLLRQQVALLAERRTALITAAVTGQIDVSTASGRGIED